MLVFCQHAEIQDKIFFRGSEACFVVGPEVRFMVIKIHANATDKPSQMSSISGSFDFRINLNENSGISLNRTPLEIMMAGSEGFLLKEVVV